MAIKRWINVFKKQVKKTRKETDHGKLGGVDKTQAKENEIGDSWRNGGMDPLV